MIEASTFEASSPLELNPPVAWTNPTAFAESEAQASDRRILIVDDEAGVRELFAAWLREENYECKTAASADEALANLATDTYALVISDMMMPGRNGVELLREVRARYPDTVSRLARL